MVMNSTTLSELQTEMLNSIKARIGKIQTGSDNTAVNAGDTDIGTLISDVTIDEIDTSVANQVTYRGKLGITLGTGSTFREIVLYNTTDSNSETRNLLEERAKAADQVFWFSIVIKTRATNSDF